MDIVPDATAVSIAELGPAWADILLAAQGSPIMVLKENQPAAYLLSAGHYEKLLSRLEDLEDALAVHERGDGPFVEVTFDEL